MSGERVADFDFELPPELIAQEPPAERGQSRMLVMNRATGELRDSQFAEFPALLRPGDLLVLNDSRVIPARLYARRMVMRDRQLPSGVIEVLLTEPAGEDLWRALVKPGKKVGVGERLAFPAPDGEIALEAEVLERGEFGERLLRFVPVSDFLGALERIGHMPLPPYIRRDDAEADRERYQTVFSRERGSVAAPTAGLHFTPQVLEDIAAKGVELARVTLHVGLDTFKPIDEDTVEGHAIHSEWCDLSAETAALIDATKRAGQRVIAVGTTSARTLESAWQPDRGVWSGFTRLFITPGYQWKCIDALITNFHLPRSTLLALVGAFMGMALMQRTYAEAIRERYRFYSFGDAMLIE